MFREAVRRNPRLAAAFVVLAAASIGLQVVIDRPDMRRQPAIEPRGVGDAATANFGGAGLPFEYSLAALSGFRQVIAGLLWVRADAFFHSGNYDAILPMIRLITWLDPNWLDVYATGAWHLMYNFTDTDQRSDRRYLPVGLALLDEGIANNPNTFEIYKEKGWNLFDKVKDFDGAVEAYAGGKKTKDSDVNQVVHLLAHSYERAGKVDESIATWQEAYELHQKIIETEGKTNLEVRSKNSFGSNNSLKNKSLLEIRKAVRPRNIAKFGPVDAQLKLKVVRTAPGILEISGSWQLFGSIKDTFDAGTFESDGVRVKTIGEGMRLDGPVGGARMEVRLEDSGYQMPKLDSFSFEIPSDVTIMQDQLTVNGGKRTQSGGVFCLTPRGGNPELVQEAANIYNYKPAEATALMGVPVADALRGAAPISAFGQWQLVSLAYPIAFTAERKYYLASEVPALFAKLKGDAKTIEEKLTKKGIYVSRAADLRPGVFKRVIDMTKDPKMYPFSKDKYDLTVTFNPRTAPDFVQDRIGWNGEGLADKRYIDTSVPGLRRLRVKVDLSKDDVLGEGEKVLFDK